MRSGSLLVGVLAVLAACPAPQVPTVAIPPVSTGKVRVRVFAEPSPVRMLAVTERFVFVATQTDVERFDAGGGVFAMSSNAALAGRQIIALGPDPQQGAVWIATNGGLGRYDATTETYSAMPMPAPSLGLDFDEVAKQAASVAPSIDGGAWLGTEQGLFYVHPETGWSATAIKDPVRALLRDRAGWLWIATPAGLRARKPSGDVVTVGPLNGCAITEPRLLIEMPGDRMLVIGTDSDGHELMAFGEELAWDSYRALPDVRWDAAAARGDGAVVMGGGRVYRILPQDPQRARPLARDGLRLAAVEGAPMSPWSIEPIDLVVPPGATSLVAADDHLLIGTRDLGTARFRVGSAQPPDWLRRNQMFEQASSLSVACAAAEDCWIATGAHKAWHWTGAGFVAGGPEHRVLAVVRDDEGTIYALHRGDAEPSVRLSKLEGNEWTEVPDVVLTTPGSEAEVSFARVAASGALWVGLRYRIGAETRGFGIAIVDPGDGKVAYHHSEGELDSSLSSVMLPVPTGIADADLRGETAWFATSQGVVRLAKGQLTSWTERDGLKAPVARAVAVASDGRVVVGTSEGAGVWDGKTWEFPAALRFSLNDVAATRNGRVWMATDRGIAAWDGSRIRRLDTRRGLAENQVLDVAVDHLDRVWARGPGSLTLLSQ
ncbi:MAG: hypothetical protein AB7O24_14270 [Kofleriaceae bacterium]